MNQWKKYLTISCIAVASFVVNSSVYASDNEEIVLKAPPSTPIAGSPTRFCNLDDLHQRFPQESTEQSYIDELSTLTKPYILPRVLSIGEGLTPTPNLTSQTPIIEKDAYRVYHEITAESSENYKEPSNNCDTGLLFTVSKGTRVADTGDRKNNDGINWFSVIVIDGPYAGSFGWINGSCCKELPHPEEKNI